jgi:hypothetical protein
MNAIDSLEKIKLEITDLIENHQSYIRNPVTKPLVDNKNFQNARLIIKRLVKESNHKFEVPSFIQDCRTIDEAVDDIFSDRAEDYYLISYVNKTLNKFIDFIEEQDIEVKVIKVEAKIPEQLTYEQILESVEKCDYRISTGDFSGAVTSAKTLVEGVCKEILHNFSDTKIDNKTDLPSLFSQVRDKLNLDPSDPKLDKALKEVLTGLIKVVSGISEIRNKRGDSHLPLYKIDMHHALMVVNSAKTVVTFLFNTYEYQLEKGNLVLVK